MRAMSPLTRVDVLLWTTTSEVPVAIDCDAGEWLSKRSFVRPPEGLTHQSLLIDSTDRPSGRQSADDGASHSLVETMSSIAADGWGWCDTIATMRPA